MRTEFFNAVLVALLFALLASGGSAATAHVFLVDVPRLEAARAGNEPAARTELIAAADKLLDAKPRSVLDKAHVPASGDKHDYFSMAPYWWPDPAKPDGLPYVRRDGELNPDSRRATDMRAFTTTCRAIKVLAAAYRVTGEVHYGAKAVQLARVWFLDPTTRMNPNFQHAQAIPGITTGRGIGIIEAYPLMDANEGLGLLADFPAWTAADQTAMRDWNERFYTWLTTAPNALDEKAALNNHGSWYDAQVAHLALVLDRREDARSLLAEGLTKRIAKQIEPDGRQPHELERTKSLGYSIFNLEAHLLCARLAEQVGVDWWRFSTADGRSLRAALRFLAPYANPAKPWVKKDLSDPERARIVPMLREFSRRVEDDEIQAAIRDAQAHHRELVRPLIDP